MIKSVRYYNGFKKGKSKKLSKEFTQYRNEYHHIEDLCEFSLSDPP